MATKLERLIREDRISRAGNSFIKRKAAEEKAARIARDYVYMEKVLDFFQETCPGALDGERLEMVKQILFNGRGSKSQLGTIKYLSRYAYDFPEWETLAKQEFGITC